MDAIAIRHRIARIIIEELKLKDASAETFDPKLDLVAQLGIDSMELTTIVVVIQDEFGIKIDEEDFGRLTTLERIADYVIARKP